MAFPYQFAACAGLKLIIILLTIAVICLIDPRYVTTYISINYQIVLIYIIAALTLLYCIVSLIMYVLMYRSNGEDMSLTNCSLSEIVFSGSGMIGWMIVCGIGANVSRRTLLETGQFFGWIGACSGVIVGMFAGVLAVFTLNLINEKVLNQNRKYTRANPPYA
uniref:MARVEL domain-containing protein n=1 Tax=Panagrellus redivivus TaxID=6233 RepID=A0A7E4W670_PANRE